MCAYVSAEDFGPIELRPGFPAQYNGPVMSGCAVSGAALDFGMMVFQEFRTPEYILRYKVFRFIQKMVLTVKEERYSMDSLLALNQDVMVRMEEPEYVHLRPMEYLLAHAAGGSQQFAFEEDKEYHLFHATYSEAYLQRVLPHGQNRYHELLQGTDLVHPAGSGIKRAHFKAMDAVKDMTLPPFPPDLHRLFFETKVREYLILLLASGTAGFGAEAIQPSAAELEKLWGIAADMREHMAHITIPELARKAHMNEYKFKVLFRQQFGMGPFEYLTKVRLQKARELLLETRHPIKNIYRMVGFTTNTGFITSFRREYGISPGKLRLLKG